MTHRCFPWSKTSEKLQDKFKGLPLLTSVPIQNVQSSFQADDSYLKGIEFQNLQLQLRQNFFIVVNTKQNEVIDAFEGQPAVLVLIKEVCPGQKIGKNASQIQIPKGRSLIKFIHRKMENCFIAFQITTDRKKLIELYRTIPKTHTIQLGFHQIFKPIKKVGQGLTSAVYQAVRTIDKTPVAVKAFNKSVYFSTCAGKGEKSFYKEMKMLVDCDHENICRFQGVYQTQNTIYIVLEYYQKTLGNLLCVQGELTREEILVIIKDLLEGLAYLHEKGIFHRDLKLQNIMLRKNTKNTSYKPVIIDLGLAEYSGTEEYLFEKCGTPGYVAPEVFTKGAKSAKCDVFSLGVIIYMMLFKEPVFRGETKEELIKNNRQGKMHLDMAALQKDEAVRDLLLKMLNLDQSNRISAGQALMHPLFSSIKLSKTTQTSISAQDLNLLKEQIKQQSFEWF